MAKKIKYAVPCEVGEVKPYLCAEKGLIGYQVGVRFKDLSNLPCPCFSNYEYMHMYRGGKGETSLVVYTFPFIGYGIINIGKLRAEHWYKKMKKQVDAYNAQQQIKR